MLRNFSIGLSLASLLSLPAREARAQTPVKDAPSHVWVADQGNGTYKNPILYADYSDPDAIRVGDDFYMTASSFNCIPGLPILHSKDLVSWTIIGHALKEQLPADVFDRPQHGNGVWAPAIRYNKGQFYIYYPDPDRGIYVIKATNAAGPWTRPVLVVAGKGLIDPCPLFEDTGNGRQTVWLVNAWAASRAEVNCLLTIRPLTPDGMAENGDARMVYDGHDRQPTLEGPKLYKRNNYYYILAPAGGVTGGWQLALRSKNIYGPYEEKIVMDQGSTSINGPHQGAWVETPSKESWFLHFQDRGPYGRVTHLQPMRWIDDWPVIGIDKDGDGKGEPVLIYKKPDIRTASNRIVTPPESDEFNGDAPGLQWQWHANQKITWSAEIPGSGYLRLFAIKQPAGATNLWPTPNLLLQKFPAPSFTATTRIRLSAAQAGKKAGLLIMGGDYSYLALQREDSGYTLIQGLCRNAEQGNVEQTVWQTPVGPPTAGSPATGPNIAGPAGAASLDPADSGQWVDCRVTVTPPDGLCYFSYSLDGQTFYSAGEPFYAKPDKWIGAKAGLFCLSPSNAKNGGYADIDWFRITATESKTTATESKTTARDRKTNATEQ